MSILLYGVIASNGLRVLVDNKIDFGKQRNLVIASAMLVIGLGGAILRRKLHDPIGNRVIRACRYHLESDSSQSVLIPENNVAYENG